MTVLWLVLTLGAAVAAAIELRALSRQRRLLLQDPQRRQFFVRYVRDGARPARRAGVRPAAPPRTPMHAPPAVAAATPPGPAAAPEGILYVDASGRCTFANREARDLLHWSGDDLRLSDILPGGTEESTALLESLAEAGVVEHHAATAVSEPWQAPLVISGVALRDRDDNLWGAAFFIHRLSPADTPSAPSRH